MQEKIMHNNIILDWGLTQCNVKKKWLFESVLVAIGVLLIAISAKISIPTFPIPTTVQDFTILFLSMIIGSKRGITMVGTYLALGFSGLPIFANIVSGPGAFLSPHAGYLLGFIPLAYTAGFLMERGWGKHILTTFFAGTIAMIMLFIAGISYLSITMNFTTAITLGMAPFMGVSLIKLVILSVIVPFFWK